MICVFSASRWRLCKATKISARAAGVFAELQKSPRGPLAFLQSYKSLRAGRWRFCRVTKVSARGAGVFVELQKSPREALAFLQSYKSLCARRWTFCSLTEVLRRRFLRHELLRQPSSDGLVVAFQAQISQQNAADINHQGRGPYLAEGIKFVVNQPGIE